LKENSCGRATVAIEDLGDGDLGHVKWLLLRRHARKCRQCGPNLNRMEAVIRALAELRRVAAPDDLVEAVIACLLSGVPVVEAHVQARERGRRNLILVFVGAGLGVAVAVALAIVRWVTGRENDEGFATMGSA
jgi:hypothetical protein